MIEAKSQHYAFRRRGDNYAWCLKTHEWISFLKDSCLIGQKAVATKIYGILKEKGYNFRVEGYKLCNMDKFRPGQQARFRRSYLRRPNPDHSVMQELDLTNYDSSLMPDSVNEPGYVVKTFYNLNLDLCVVAALDNYPDQQFLYKSEGVHLVSEDNE